MRKKFTAHKYLETTLEQTDEKILVVTLESVETGRKRFAVPLNSQIAMRVKYYITNGINDYLETDLLGESDLVNLTEFNLMQQHNRFGELEDIYFHKSLSATVSSTKILSESTILKLEHIFDTLTNISQIENSRILGHLRSNDGAVNIYLIAKFTDDDIFLAIVEHEFAIERQIQQISLAQIREMGLFSEILTKEFSTQIYIQTGNKI